MPRKQKEQRKGTPARGEWSSGSRAQFLLRFRMVRDASAAEYGACLQSARTWKDARGDFNTCLNRLCGTFPGLLAGHAQHLCEKGFDLAQVKSELEAACSDIKAEAKNWLALACYGELPGPDWFAPRYMAGYPEQIEPSQRHMPLAMLHGPLDAEATRQIVEKVENALAERFDIAKDFALEQAADWISGQQPPTKRAPAPPRLNKTKMQIALIKRKHPGARTTKEICQLLDNGNVPIPAEWSESGVRLWTDSWTKYRGKVKAYIAKVLPAAKD